MRARKQTWERIGWLIACTVYAIYMVGCIVALCLYARR
jgi:hypothetical protein